MIERFLLVNHGKSFVAHIGDGLNITVPKGLRIHTCVSSFFSIFDSFLGKWFSDIFKPHFQNRSLALWKESSTPHPSLPWVFCWKGHPHRFRRNKTQRQPSTPSPASPLPAMSVTNPLVFPTFIDSSWQIWVKSWQQMGLAYDWWSEFATSTTCAIPEDVVKFS